MFSAIWFIDFEMNQIGQIDSNPRQQFVCDTCGYFGTLSQLILHVTEKHKQTQTVIRIYPITRRYETPQTEANSHLSQPTPNMTDLLEPTPDNTTPRKMSEPPPDNTPANMSELPPDNNVSPSALPENNVSPYFKKVK